MKPLYIDIDTADLQDKSTWEQAKFLCHSPDTGTISLTISGERLVAMLEQWTEVE